MKKQIVNFLINLGIDIIFGLVASVFAYFVLSEIIPNMLATSLNLGNGAIKFDLLIDKETMKQIFSLWHNFCIIFGIRFLVGYICGNYRLVTSQKLENEL